MRSLAVLALVVVGCRGSREELPARTPVPLPAEVRGANLRPVGDLRRGYGTERARETMVRLHGMGVNTISVLLEGHMNDLADPVVRGPSVAERTAAERALLDANDLGFATILIPHLYLDDGEWRGRILAEDEFDRDHFTAWWASYDEFVRGAAELATRGSATLLAVGVELKGLSGRPESVPEMARLVTEVRRTYPGLIAYDANWDEAEAVRFWPLVDLAGVNGYYPLEPDPIRGAEKVAWRLAALHELAERDVLLFEVGYRSSPSSHVRPWEWPEAVAPEVDVRAQADAFAAVLGSWPRVRGVRGLAFWAVPTDPDDPASEPAHGFNPLNKPAEAVIRRAWRSAE